VATGVGVAQGVVVDIRIPVQRLRVPRLGHDGIRLEEATQGGVIEARLVIVEPEGSLPPLPGEAAVGGESPISGKGRDGEESENIRNPSMLLLRCFLLP
jgi:hypothetical protein